MRLVIRIVTLTTVGLCFCLAHAQIASSGPAALARQMPNIYAPYLANISRVKILQRQGKLKPGYGGAATRKSTPPATPQPGSKNPQPSSKTPPAISDTTFTPVGAPFVPHQLSVQLGKSPQEQKYIEEVLTKCLNFYKDNAQQKGVPLNDVARALNYYIATSYFVYSNGSGPSQKQMDATRDTIKTNLIQDETFKQMSDRQKQEAYETLIVLAGFVDLGYGTTRQNGNDASAAQFRDMAKHNLETLLGVPVDKIHFTDDGLQLN
jgi:hypothetical protein